MENGTWSKALLAAALIGTILASKPLLSGAAAGKGIVVGIVTGVTGKPEVTRIATSKTERLKNSVMVYEGDVVKTGKGEQVAVALVGGVEVRINEGSNFEMESGGGRREASLMTKLGQIWTKRLHGMSTIRLRSNLAVCSVRGTEADVDVDERMTVKVYDGVVDISNDLGRQSLIAGQISQVAGPGAAPSAPRTLSQQEYGTWQNGVAVSDLDNNLQKLRKEAEKTKAVEIEMKDGKKIKMKFEKK